MKWIFIINFEKRAYIGKLLKLWLMDFYITVDTKSTFTTSSYYIAYLI